MQGFCRGGIVSLDESQAMLAQRPERGATLVRRCIWVPEWTAQSCRQTEPTQEKCLCHGRSTIGHHHPDRSEDGRRCGRLQEWRWQKFRRVGCEGMNVHAAFIPH
jgi:hypothetical protein